jgi:hypothetical protein
MTGPGRLAAYWRRPAEYGSHQCAIPDPASYPPNVGNPGYAYVNWCCPVCESNWLLTTYAFTPERQGGPHSGSPLPWDPVPPLPTEYYNTWTFDFPSAAPSGATLSVDGRFWRRGDVWRLIPPEARTFRPYKQQR